MSKQGPEYLTEDERRQLQGGLSGYHPKEGVLPDAPEVVAQGVDPEDVSTPLIQEGLAEAIALRQGLGG